MIYIISYIKAVNGSRPESGFFIRRQRSDGMLSYQRKRCALFASPTVIATAVGSPNEKSLATSIARRRVSVDTMAGSGIAHSRFTGQWNSCSHRGDCGSRTAFSAQTLPDKGALLPSRPRHWLPQEANDGGTRKVRPARTDAADATQVRRAHRIAARGFEMLPASACNTISPACVEYSSLHLHDTCWARRPFHTLARPGQGLTWPAGPSNC